MSYLETKVEGVILLYDVGEIDKIEALNRIDDILGTYLFNSNNIKDENYNNVINKLSKKGFITEGDFYEKVNPFFEK